MVCSRSMCALLISTLLFSLACSSKKLDASVEVVPGVDDPTVTEVHVRAIEESTVELVADFKLDGTSTRLSEVVKGGEVVFKVRSYDIPAGPPVEAKVEVTHHTIKGAKFEQTIPFERLPALVEARTEFGPPRRANTPQDSQLQCEGEPACSIRGGAHGKGGKFGLKIKAPAGTKVTVGDKSGELPASGELVLVPELLSKLSALDAEALTSPTTRATTSRSPSRCRCPAPPSRSWARFRSAAPRCAWRRRTCSPRSPTDRSPWPGTPTPPRRSETRCWS